MTDAPESGARASGSSLNELFTSYRKKLARTLARIVKPHDVEDIVQETYLRIYQAAQREPITHPRSFMLRAARNLALNHVARADALNYLAPAPEPDVEGVPEENFTLAGESLESTAQAEEEFLIFCRSVRELPLQCRRAFILRKVYGMSQRETAQQLGVSEGTVEKHIAKGIAACSAYMSLHGYARANDKAGSQSLRKRSHG